jgi:SagB-type dehydrogenase family enzyme
MVRAVLAQIVVVLLALGRGGELWAEPGPERIELPAPATSGTVSLEEALATRRSRRSVSPKALSRSTIGQLAWAAQGITLPDKGFRTAPSAGARYPLRLYVALPEGLYLYQPRGHVLLRKSARDLRKSLWKDVYTRPWLADAPAIFLIAADPRRSAEKYGKKALRFVHIEVGHAGQNLLLEATALGLHGVGVGAFHEARCKKTLGLPEAQELLYVLPVGRPPDE